MKRILYIQYTNPASYPPLEHSSRMLADAGWQVLFLGTRPAGTEELRFPPHAGIAVKYMDFCPAGWRQKIHYFLFGSWALAWAMLWRARWIYASDVLISPAALVLTWFPWLRVLYHEHDSPGDPRGGGWQRVVQMARRSLARRATCCVLPNERRMTQFRTATATRQPIFCVWNCPSRQEVSAGRSGGDGSLWLLYQGSIVPARLPLAVVGALTQLPDCVKLRVIGYETAGSRGYIEQLRDHARQLGVEHRIDIVGVLAHRFELIGWVRRCDAGLSLMPIGATDINERSMTGASNKAFDYLASGLPLVVSDLPDWRATYVEPGYGLACDPQDPESIARSVRRFLDDPELARSMGERGRQRILSEWNYETCFQPVLRCLEA